MRGFKEMRNIFFCLGAFLCFFLYDWNEARGEKGILRFAFLAGCALWAAATIGLLRRGWLEVGYRGKEQFL